MNFSSSQRFILYAYQLTESFTVEKLGEIVQSCYAKVQEQQKAEGYIKLERGFATIPLPRIDVPFHLRYLWAGILPFRACMTNYCFLLSMD